MATRRSSNKAKSSVLNPFSVLTRFSVLALGVLAFPGIASAQSKLIPGIDVFGGYSHLTIPTKDFGFDSHTQMNGFHVALAIELYKGLGIVAETTGHYSTPLEQYNYAVGGQYTWKFNYFRVTGHGLYGKAQTRVRNVGTTFVEPSDRQRAVTFGGSIDVPVRSTFWFRVVQADWIHTTAFDNKLNELRLSTGLVYSFGKH